MQDTQPVAEVSGVTDASPDRFERALRVMARHVAESNAAASRCDNPRDAGIAVEYRTEADAVLCSLVDVIVAGGVEDRDAARAQAYRLIAEAVNSRG
ncbi:MAG: hypothetical protein JWN52_6625 [Actinomycetia bacterium]|nr:hypothetical protein [Actinomycetes bacterium]